MKAPVLWLVLAVTAFGQTAVKPRHDGHWCQPPLLPYEAPHIAPVSLDNTDRLNQLLRAGNLYLSLHGSPVPVFDPAITGSLEWQHMSTPEVSTVISGSNALVGRSLTGVLGYTQAFSLGTQKSTNFNAESQNEERATGETLDNHQISLDDVLKGHVSAPPAALPKP